MSQELGPQDVLFMGQGRTANGWYRCYLPALALGADWVGIVGKPPEIYAATGFVRGSVQNPVYEDYKVIVIQQPRGHEWVEWITDLRSKGVKVLYEVDDDLHAVARMKTHTKRKNIRNHLPHYEMCMRWCDGIIASTPELARKVARFNKKVWVCEAGIDMERYQLKRNRNGNNDFVIGFAGGFGHEVSLDPWIAAIENVVGSSPEARFMCVGMDYSDKVSVETLAIPFSQVEAWPSVLSNFDVLLAPGGNNGFFKAKSELKWIEAAAMGIPVIANRVPYHSIKHFDTGFIVDNFRQVENFLHFLITDRMQGYEIGAAAREAVLERHHIRNAAEAWINVFEACT